MLVPGRFLQGRIQRIHFVGIGGVGMSGIAEVLLTSGYKVSGSDLREGPSVQRLRELGALVTVGHAPENLGDAMVLVKSTAVGTENPEVREAVRRGVPVIARAEMLAELMRMKLGLAVAGTHGKTTTTSMLAQIMASAGFDPTIVVGGRFDAIGSNARLGQGEFLVAEADESDGSFLHLTPTAAIITNIDPEHLEHYGSFEALKQTFVTFANKVPFYGFVVVCLDHPVVQELLPELRKRVVTYGLSRQAHLRADGVVHEGMGTRFTVLRGGQPLGEVSLGMPGAHNVSNALAALAMGLELGVPFEVLQRALDGFTGVNRRFTVVGEAGGVMIVDDYAHHPAEIVATLGGARAGFGERRIVAVFQPHRYTRARDLFNEFCRAFNLADHVLVLPVYAAGEAPIEGVHAEALVEGLRAHGHRSAERARGHDEALAQLVADARPGDIVITLGAGDVNRLCAPLLEALS